jgi:hypothetical protein
MNPLFIATPAEASISTALRLWPELAGKRVRPLLVSAFGDIYVEANTGEVWVAQPIELACEQVANSAKELQGLFSNVKWARERLLTEVALLAHERGTSRPDHQVFSIAPHPLLGGQIRVENLVAMDLEIWHHLCSEIKAHAQGNP